MVNHQHLRAFHAVAVEGSFSRAARRLNISQPTLSQQIKALENRHGRKLFETRRSPLRLSPIGQELLVLTRRMFATSKEIDDLLGDRLIGETVSVRLVSDSPTYAAQLARALLEATPEADVEVQIANSQGTLSRLLEARADVAIASDPQIDPRFAYRPLFVDHLRVVVSENHPLARANAFPLAQLARECLLLREASSKTRAATDSLLRAHEIVPLRTIELHSREAIREGIAAGLGVSLFFSAECPPDARLVSLSPDCQPDPALLTGYVVCCVEQRRSAVMRAVLAAAASLLAMSPIPLADMAEDYAPTEPRSSVLVG